MKRFNSILILFFLNLSFNTFAQTTDFFAGKWEISVAGTPNGDVKFTTNLVRKDGKLTGELTDATGQLKEPIPITNIEDTDGKLTIYFSAQGYDINVDLTKVDNDNLKGTLMGMFEAKAKRLANTPTNDFFAGKWEISVAGTPIGDVKLLTDLVRKDGKLTGELKVRDEVRPITKIDEAADKITIFFNSSQAGDISVDLTKVDQNNLKGLLMTYEAKATRVK